MIRHLTDVLMVNMNLLSCLYPILLSALHNNEGYPGHSQYCRLINDTVTC